MITWLESLPQVTQVLFSGEGIPTNMFNSFSFNPLSFKHPKDQRTGRNLCVTEESVYLILCSKYVKLSKYDFQIKHKYGNTDLHRHGNIKVRLKLKHLHLNSS